MMKWNFIFFLKLLLIHVFFLACLVLDVIYKDDMFNDSLGFAKEFQSGSNKALDLLFLIFCNLMNPITIALLSIFYYSYAKNKVQALVFLINQILIAYIYSLIKMAFHDARPYWVDSRIVAKECYLEYGNPSGHTLMATFLLGSIWYSLFQDSNKKQEDNSPNSNLNVNLDYENLMIDYFPNKQTSETDPNASKTPWKSRILFIVATVTSICLLVLISLGRIYLGMHSYDQVLMGIVFGMYFLLIYHLVFKQLCVSAIFVILRKNLKARKKHELCSFPAIFKIFLLYTVFLSIPLCCLEMYKPESTESYDAWTNNIGKACHFDKFSAFTEKCYLDTASISFAFGVLFGLSIPVGDYNPTIFLGSFDTTLILHEERMPIFKIIARGVIVLVGSLFWVPIFFFIPIPNSHHIVFAYFININLSGLFAGCSLMIGAQYLLWRCGLENSSDLVHFGKK